MFLLWFWQVVWWDATAMPVYLSEQQRTRVPKDRDCFGFATPWKPGWLRQWDPSQAQVWGTQGLCQAPHCAGVPHTPLLSSTRVQPTKQTPLKSSGGISSALHLWASTGLEAAVCLVCSSVRQHKKPETKQLSFFIEWDKENNRRYH